MRTRVILVAAIVLATTGCGTIMNLSQQRLLLGPSGTEPLRVYGGVRRHTEHLPELVEYSPGELASLVPWQVGDMALSLVGDTVTLPWVVWRLLTDPTAKGTDAMADSYSAVSTSSNSNSGL